MLCQRHGTGFADGELLILSKPAALPLRAGFAVQMLKHLCFAKISNQHKTAKQFWTALAGPEGIKPQVLQMAPPDRSTALALNSFSWSEGQGAARVKPAIKSTF
jgi:hypothetical protein